MLNKSIALGLLAFGLMVAPTTAFAGQSQNNVQTTEQSGAATNGSTTAQSSESINNQVQSQIQKARRGVNPYSYGGHRYSGRSCRSGSTAQSQNSAQGVSQNGAATDGSTTAQSNNTVNNQAQSARRGC
ncbi:MAG: hypothetical protein PUP91_02310 [Rhizonema sp. PD37]|nr:hypothetical protein [Rhizonema sp. PD37]